MKKSNMKSLLGILFLSCMIASCGEDSEPSPPVPVDPSDPDALTSVLVIGGTSASQTGELPSSSIDSDAPNINNNQSSATVVSGHTLYLPFNFETSGTSYGGTYIQVDGAGRYWRLPGGSSDVNGLVVVPVTIPSNVEEGDFCLTYGIYDSNNEVSNFLQTCVSIEPIQECPGYDSGNDGLTIVSYDLGDQAGEALISYDMYTITDRMDVFYNNKWVGGTGSSLSAGQFPPVSDCYDNANGYVSGTGEVTVDYNPSVSRLVTIYMSGCVGGGTAWDLYVGCPQ